MTGPISNRAALTWASYSGMFVFGIDLAILGALLPSLFREMHLEASQAGGLFVFLNGGALVVTMLSGPAFDRFGFKILLLVASVLDAASLLGIAHAQTYPSLALCSFLLGLGGGGLNSGTNAFIADLYPEAQAAALSRLGVFFGFGACFIPIFIGSLLSFLSLKAILILTASIALVPGAPVSDSALSSRETGGHRFYLVPGARRPEEPAGTASRHPPVFRVRKRDELERLARRVS